jgi:elongation factor P
MATYGMSEFRGGLKIIMDGDPYNVVDIEFVKPGKGQAFNRVRLRNLKTGKVIERTFKAFETFQSADIFELNVQYLYNDGEFWHFMNPETFEQHAVSKESVGDDAKWMKEEDMCQMMLYNGEPLSVKPPNFAELRIVETDPGVRGDTSGGGGKPATLETGAVVRVPLFVGSNELIRVDTRTGEYVSRVKE